MPRAGTSEQMIRDRVPRGREKEWSEILSQVRYVSECFLLIQSNISKKHAVITDIGKRGDGADFPVRFLSVLM